jgi:hypothetical protein
LEVADNEFKPNMTTQIGIAADRFAPNKRWHIDTMLRVLKLVRILGYRGQANMRRLETTSRSRSYHRSSD